MIVVENTERYFISNDPILVDGKIYVSTDKNKYKIGTGSKWSLTNYTPAIIQKSTGKDGHFWKFTSDDTGMLSQSGEDLGE